MGVIMRSFIAAFFILFLVQPAAAQNAFTFCDKAGDCSMTFEEFAACKKMLVTTDKETSVSSFVLTVKKKEKKDYVFLEFSSKSNTIGKDALQMIDQLHKDKKLGDKIEISNVEVVQSGKAARKVNGMVITITN